jgi:hypothetical protein
VIRPPRRAVTRFLVPFIDVLILLFCIFLLMPFVSQPSTEATDPAAGPTEPPDPTLPKEVVELQTRLRSAEREVARLRKAERADVSERLSVRVLEIDKATGRLYAYDPDRQEVRSEEDAQRLIRRQKSLAGVREVFFLILYPRELSGYPEQQQVDAYRRWFRDVPHGFDNPLAGR